MDNNKYMLTKETYFGVNNRALTNSKIKDFNICPNYFYRKHITGEIPPESKYHYAVGGAVDDILTQIESKDKFICVSRRNLKNPPVGVIELNPTQYAEVIELADAVESTSAWADLKLKGEFQKILEVPQKIGEHFDILAGIPDHLYFDKDNATVYITDLKTSQTIEPGKYHWHCEEYGYYRQMGFYWYLIKCLYPDIKTFVARHIVVEKTKNIYRVRTFTLCNDRVEMALRDVLEDIERIKTTKNFDKQDATWANSITIGEF